MTKTAIQHEHKEFIDDIMYKVRTHSRLVSMSDYSKDLERFKELIGEQKALIGDIENSRYRRLDEVGDST